jgi:DNA-binding MarR family transcriptional regulator
MRLVKVLPRHLDADLMRGAGITASEYTTIMTLSESPNRELRMTELANAAGMSASRTTRLVDDLRSRGLVTKIASSSDARGNIARLTAKGMAKLKSAWPVHLESVRRRFFDHLQTLPSPRWPGPSPARPDNSRIAPRRKAKASDGPIRDGTVELSPCPTGDPRPERRTSPAVRLWRGPARCSGAGAGGPCRGCSRRPARRRGPDRG